MKIALVMATVLFIGACKISSSDFDKNKVKEDTKVGEIKIQKERNLSLLEKEILLRVCTQTKKKRELFESLDYLKERVVFNRNNRDCDGGVIGLGDFEVSLDNSSPREMVWSNDFAGYFIKDIVTDTSTNLRTFCEVVSKDINIEIKNSWVTSNIKTVINVLIDSGYDRVEFVHSVKKKDEYKASSAEGMTFFTQSVQAPLKMMGMEKSRSRYTLCENGRTAYYKQDLMRLLTKFEKN